MLLTVVDGQFEDQINAQRQQHKEGQYRGRYNWSPNQGIPSESRYQRAYLQELKGFSSEEQSGPTRIVPVISIGRYQEKIRNQFTKVCHGDWLKINSGPRLPGTEEILEVPRYARDDGWPQGTGVQAQAPNRRKLRCLKVGQPYQNAT